MVAAPLWLVVFVALGGPVCDAAAPPASEAPMAPSLEPEFRRLRDALKASPEFQRQDHEAHFRLAETLAHHGDMSGAIEEYRAAIRLRPDAVGAWRGLGSILLDQRDYAGAVDALETAASLKEDDGDVWYWYGRASMGMQNWPRAAAALKRAIALRPDDAEAYADLGLVLMLARDPAGAEEALRSSLRIKPDNADAHHLLELLAGGSSSGADAAREVWRRVFARE